MESVLAREDLAIVEAEILKLEPRRAEVLKRRYGLCGERESGTARIAEALGTSRQRGRSAREGPR